MEAAAGAAGPGELAERATAASRLTVAPEGHQQWRDVRERGGQQQEQSGLGAEPRAVAALHRVREELVERHERRADSGLGPLRRPTGRTKFGFSWLP